MKSLPDKFLEYIAPDCDRLLFLQNYFSENGVATSVINLGTKKHLYINFPTASYDPTFKMKTIICHYDRVEGSPGANDNSAANFAVADFAVRLSKISGFIHNIRIIFTDGEELGGEGVSSQGAYALAELFRKLGITNEDVYVFDACGRGEVAVLAQAGLSAGMNSDFRKKFLSLFKRTQTLLASSCPQSWMNLPVPYSDNAGFLACGIPAVAITMLPKDEATLYFKNLMADKKLEKAIMNCSLDSGNPDRTELSIQRFKYKEKMPMTWRLFHTEFDNHFSLTAESFHVMEKILAELAKMKTPAFL